MCFTSFKEPSRPAPVPTTRPHMEAGSVFLIYRRTAGSAKAWTAVWKNSAWDRPWESRPLLISATETDHQRDQETQKPWYQGIFHAGCRSMEIRFDHLGGPCGCAVDSKSRLKTVGAGRGGMFNHEEGVQPQHESVCKPATSMGKLLSRP